MVVYWKAVRVAGLLCRISSVTADRFPSQRASDAERWCFTVVILKKTHKIRQNKTTFEYFSISYQSVGSIYVLTFFSQKWNVDFQAFLYQILLIHCTVPYSWRHKSKLTLAQATSHYLNQCWPDSLMHTCDTRGRWVKPDRGLPGMIMKECAKFARDRHLQLHAVESHDLFLKNNVH